MSRLRTHSRGWLENLRVAFLRSAFGMYTHLGHSDRIVCEVAANLYPPPPRNEGNNHFHSVPNRDGMIVARNDRIPSGINRADNAFLTS